MRKGLVAAILIACFTMMTIAACSSYNDKRGRGDAPIGPFDDSPAEVINMPDRFANVANKCDGHGHRVYSTTREAAVTVIADPSCSAGPTTGPTTEPR